MTLRPASQMSLPQLHRRRKGVLDHLRELDADSVAELEFLDQIIAGKQASQGGPYAVIRTPKKAIHMLFDELGDVELSVDQLTTELASRGFPLNLRADRYLLRDAVNYLIEIGELKATNEDIGKKKTVRRVPFKE